MRLIRGFAAVSLGLGLCSVFGLALHSGAVRAENSTSARPAIPVTLVVNGKSRTVTSTAAEVSTLLQGAGLQVQPGDLVHPPLDSRTFPGMTVNVSQLQKRVGAVRIQQPFPTVLKRTVRLLPGRRADAQKGVPGIKEEQVEVTTLGGREIGRKVVSTRWLRKPVQRVVLVGTDPFLASRGIDGIRRMMTLSATEYDIYLGGAGTGYTRTGVHARRGIVAVDPRVIPLGTRLYVEGYGYCVAADTGGAIKGHRIDLCVETPAEADRYGRHTVRAFILD